MNSEVDDDDDDDDDDDMWIGVPTGMFIIYKYIFINLKLLNFCNNHKYFF
jgi:hypothetical protein